jgi:hypothetical protein
LEVLISLFVLMIALLGLISVLPLADRAMEEAVRADRVQACGQAALQELMMRELLSGVDGQRHPLLSPYVWWNIYLRPVLPQANPLLDVSQGYAIDPWLIAQTADRYLDGQNNWIDPGAQRLEVFPWVPVSQNPPGPDWYWPQLTLRRVTIAVPDVFDSQSNQMLPRSVVQRGRLLRIFRLEDDLTIAPPPGDQDRPQVLNVEDTSSPANPIKPLLAGNYSWLVTLSCEAPPDASSGNLLPLRKPLRYRVSVVVFYKRETLTPLDYDQIGAGGSPASEEPPPDTPPERTVIATVLGTAPGGTELRLVVPPSRAGYLEGIRVGQWVMVTGWDPLKARAIHQWMRVAGLSETYEYPDNSGNLARELTLLGGEWNISSLSNWTSWCLRDPATGNVQDFNNDGEYPDVQVCLFSGVVGVYTTTLEVY